MKVIICFGSIRVVVPCGDGELTIKELMDRAVHRYTKTLERPHGVNILNLKTLDNNALLDPSDRLKDVVDDKDQLVATYVLTENILDHRNGDGMSKSPSPELQKGFRKDLSYMKDFDPMSEIIVTTKDMKSNDHKLVVRRCSEEIIDFPPHHHEKASSLPVQMSGETSSLRNSKRKSRASPHFLPRHQHLTHELNVNQRYNDRIIPSNQSNSVRNAPKNEPTTKQQPCDGHRSNEAPKGNFRIVPLKSSDSSNNLENHYRLIQNCTSERSKYGCHREEDLMSHRHLPPIIPSTDSSPQYLKEKVVSARDMLGISTSNSSSRKEKFAIELTKGIKGLGFSVTTQDNKTTEDGNLIFVKKILPSGSAIEDGRLQPGDCILEVNGVSMTGKAQEEVVAFLRRISNGESANLLIARSPNSHYLPSNNITDNMPNKSERKMDLGSSGSEGTCFNNLSKRKQHNQKNDQQDTDSILSSEGESRSCRSRFTREGPGRRSMSEKRKGHVDPRTTEIYERIRNQRTERNIQRADSAESLVGKCVQQERNYPSSFEEILGGFRTRAINDSFRVAVDKCLNVGSFKNPSHRSRNTNPAQINEYQREKIVKGFGNILNFGNIKMSAENHKHSDRWTKNHHEVSRTSEFGGLRDSPTVRK